MPITTPAQLLLAIAEREPLEATCAALGIGRPQAAALLRGAAKALQEQQGQHAAAPARAGVRAPSPPAADPRSATVPTPPLVLAKAGGRRPSSAELDKAAAALLSGAGPAAMAAVAGAYPRDGGGQGGAPSRPTVDSAGSREPLPPRVVVYSDGASRGNPGPGGAGAVIAEPGGRILRRLGKFLGRVTTHVAEYEGVLLGLRAALAGGVREVVLRADSELAIRQLDGVYQVKNAALKPLFNEARALLGRFDKVTLQHVPRAQNAAADEMSNRAIDEQL